MLEKLYQLYTAHEFFASCSHCYKYTHFFIIFNIRIIAIIRILNIDKQVFINF